MDISVGSFRRSEEKRSTVIESRSQSNRKAAVSEPLAKEIPGLYLSLFEEKIVKRNKMIL